MKENNLIKSLKEGIVSILAALIFINLVMGIFPLLILLIPVPFIVLGIRNDIYTSIGSMTIFTMILASISNTSLAMSFFIVFMPFIITIQYYMEKKEVDFNIVVRGALVLLVSLVIILSLEYKTTGINITEELEKGFNSMIDAQMEMFKELDFTNSETNKVKDSLEALYDYTLVVMPSIFLLISLMGSYLSYKLSAFILNNMGYRKIKIPIFSQIKLPDSILLGSATILIATIIIDRLELSYHNALMANVSVLLSSIFSIQGLAIFSFLLKKIRMGKIMRTIIIFMNIMFPPARLVIMIAGFMDSIFDFRKIRKKAL